MPEPGAKQTVTAPPNSLTPDGTADAAEEKLASPESKPDRSGSRLSRFWNRLRDRSRWPRSWWYPLPAKKKELSPEKWKEHHDGCSQTIRRAMLTLLGFSFFSVTILGKSDVTLLDAAATVKIPFAETEIGFVDFLIIAPFVLVGIAVYMHVFIGYWRLLQIPEDGNPGLPFLFNVSHPGAWLLSQAVFYGLVPTVLCYFSYKSSPRPEGQVMASFGH